MILFTCHLLVDSIMPMLIGHWSSNGQTAGDAYNMKGKNGSNVFPSEDLGLLLEKIIDRFSFLGQLVLDVCKTNGK